MEQKKQADQLCDKKHEFKELKKDHTDLIQKAAKLYVKQTEVNEMQSDLEKLVMMMSQVDKHMKTLIK